MCKKKVFTLINSCLLSALVIWGQCPEKEILWKRLISLRDSIKPPARIELQELLGYQDEMNNCPYKNDSTQAFLFRRIGTLYYQQSDFLRAEKYYRQYVDILAANAGKPSANPKLLTAGYYWLSAIYDSLHNYTQKMRALDSCAIIAMRLKYVDGPCLSAVYARVEYFFDLGDYIRCIDYAKKCVSLAREYANSKGDQQVAQEYASSSLGWNVEALLRLGDFISAERLLANKLDEYKKEGLKKYLGVTSDQLAHVQMYKGDYEKALLFLNQSLKYEQEAGNDFNYKQGLNTIGYEIYFKHFNRGDKALVYYKNAFKHVTKDKSIAEKDAIESLNILCRIANVYVNKGFFDSAFRYFQLAFDQIKPGINENDILNSRPQYKKIHYLASLLIDKGDAYQKQFLFSGKPDAITKAIRVYKVADEFLDKIKGDLSDLESKLFWRSDGRRLYENAIKACYLQNNPAEAFYFFEKSRAVLLQDQLNEQRWLNGDNILQQTQLKKKILQLKRDPNNTDKSSPNYEALQNELFVQEQQLDLLQQNIKTNNPLYFQSFLDKNFIEVTDVQQYILKNDQTLVELFAGDSTMFILIITPQKINLGKINKQAFDSLSTSFNSSISNLNLLNQNFNGFINVSHQLYQLIFHETNLPAGRVIVSPDGRYFPFEALVTDRNPISPNYFVFDHAVSYTYSARYLMNRFTNSDLFSGNFLGVAPVQYAGLPALLGSDRSLQKLLNHFSDGENLLHANASRSNFLGNFYKYKIIQLYTHATDSAYNNEPVIYFADSALLLSDLIYENKPATILIVLSACETGLGELHAGEGIFSFNRGFAAMGIPSSISTLWQVENESTYCLTELFYKYLADDLPLDIALQKAKKEFLQTASREKQLPYYWAAPILAGKTDAIELKKGFFSKWFTVLAFVAAVSSLLLIFQLKRKKISRASTEKKI